MGIDDLKNKAGDALSSDKGEKASDAALDKGGDAASRATGGKHDLQRQDEPGKLASGGNLHQGTGFGAGVGPDPKCDAIDAARAACGQFDRLHIGDEARFFELQRPKLARDLLDGRLQAGFRLAEA